MIGTGIFTTSGFLAGDLGSPKLVLWIWVVGAIVALCGAFCYSELGVNMPSSGGEYVYLTQAFGPTWGFMTGWVSFFAGFSAPIAAGALAFADYLGHFFPALHEEHEHVLLGSGAWPLSFGDAQMVACALIAVFTIINIFGVMRVARLQNVLTGAKILVLVAFIAMAFTMGNGEWGNFSLNAARTAKTSLSAQFAISLFWIYFAYSGWNAATYVAEELRQPARTLPLALTVGTVLVGALYVALNVVFIYAAPLEVMKGELAVGALAASRLFGPQVADMFSALLALSLMSMVNAMVTIGPRVYYAMAKNKAFLSAAAKVHPKYHTPVAAIVAQGLCAMLLTMTPFPQLVQYIGFTLNFFAVMSVVSLLMFRRRAGWQKLGVVSFAYPLIPIVFLIVGLWMTVMGLQLKPWISLAAVVTLATGAIFYHYGLRTRAHQAETPTIETY
jgi:basic amino acid/polyamine antiporter, APA family